MKVERTIDYAYEKNKLYYGLTYYGPCVVYIYDCWSKIHILDIFVPENNTYYCVLTSSGERQQSEDSLKSEGIIYSTADEVCNVLFERLFA